MDSCYSGNLHSATSRFYQPQSARTAIQVKEKKETFHIGTYQPYQHAGCLLSLDAEWLKLTGIVAKVVSRQPAT